jgi:hypothetical protein
MQDETSTLGVLSDPFVEQDTQTKPGGDAGQLPGSFIPSGDARLDADPDVSADVEQAPPALPTLPLPVEDLPPGSTAPWSQPEFFRQEDEDQGPPSSLTSAILRRPSPRKLRGLRLVVLTVLSVASAFLAIGITSNLVWGFSLKEKVTEMPGPAAPISIAAPPEPPRNDLPDDDAPTSAPQKAVDEPAPGAPAERPGPPAVTVTAPQQFDCSGIRSIVWLPSGEIELRGCTLAAE